MKKTLFILFFLSITNINLAQVCGNGIVESGEECDGTPDCTSSCTLIPAGTFFVDPSYGLFYNATLQPGIKSPNRGFKFNYNTNEISLVSNYNSVNLPYSIAGTSTVSSSGINTGISIASGFDNALKRNYPLPVAGDFFVGNLYGQTGAPSGVDIRLVTSGNTLLKRITPSNVSQNQIDIFAATVQSDGKILLAGRGLTSQGKILLIRLNSNYTNDITFGGGGYRLYSFGTDCQARAIGLQSDGKIIVAGHRIAPGSEGFLMRLNSSDGSLDTSFGTNGMKTFFYELQTQNNYFQLNNITEVYSMYIDINDNIYVCGKGSASNLWNGKIIPVVNAFSPNGNSWLMMRDSTHTTATSLLNVSGEAYKILGNASTGDIYLAGYSVDGVDKGLYVERFNSVAEVDPNFIFKTNSTAPHGYYNISSGDDIIYDMAIQNDGKLVLVGESNNEGFYTRIMDPSLANSTFTAEKNTITLSPNPVLNTLNINFENITNEKVKISILDIFGREVLTVLNPIFNSENNISINNLETLSNGIYILKISSPTSIQKIKFIKN